MLVITKRSMCSRSANHAACMPRPMNNKAGNQPTLTGLNKKTAKKNTAADGLEDRTANTAAQCRRTSSIDELTLVGEQMRTRCRDQRGRSQPASHSRLASRRAR